MPTKYIGDGADEHLVGEGMRGMRGVAEGRGHAHKGALRGLIRLNQAPSSSIKLHQAPSSSIRRNQRHSGALRARSRTSEISSSGKDFSFRVREERLV